MGVRIYEKNYQKENLGAFIFTTVQKFTPVEGELAHPILNDRHNIVVISDEAHRSQYGLKAKLKKDGTYKFGYAKHLRDAIPNATFIGFTGTPLSMEDRDTRSVFGDYISIYDIQDAVEDRATVPIYYQPRLVKIDINREEIDKLSAQVDEVMEDEESIAEKEKVKGKWSSLAELVGAEDRLKQVAEDLIVHYENRIETLAGKAMFVAMSRDICVRLYDKIVELRPDWHDEDPTKGAIKVVMTGSASDKPHLRPHIYNKQTRKDLEKRFKDVSDPLNIVIVRDMWLTGFDVPCCHTMYIDKPMKGHGLMQAIARVNRVFRDKPEGLVVDYIGIGNDLQKALKNYSSGGGKGGPTVDVEKAYHIFIEKLDAARGMLAKFDYSAFEIDSVRLLPDAANYVLSLPDGKKRFFDIVLAMTKAYSLCGTLDEVEPLKREVAFLSAVKVAIAKFSSTDKKRTKEERESLLKQILDNAVVSEGVTDLFEFCGIDKPDISVLSPEFLQDVKDMPHKNLAIELLKKLLKDEIRSKSKNNVVQEKEIFRTVK